MELEFWSNLTSDANVAPFKKWSFEQKNIKVCSHTKLCLWQQDTRGEEAKKFVSPFWLLAATEIDNMHTHHWKFVLKGAIEDGPTKTGNWNKQELYISKFLLRKKPDKRGIKKERQ